MADNRFNVAIVEPSEIFRVGLAQIIASSNNFVCNRVVSSLPLDVDDSSDIIFVNPSIAPYGTIKHIFPNAKIVAILYNYVDQSVLRQFDDTVEINDSGEKIMTITQRAMESRNSSTMVGDPEELSEREREILVAVAKGMLNKEIADSFNISIHTVVAHRKNISRKTSIKSVSGLVVYALLNNLVTESEILM